MCNFYSCYFEENRYLPLIRKGMRIELKDNIAYLDGICSYRVIAKPLIYDGTMSLEQLFCQYSDKVPWIAKEEDGEFYLYKGSIDKTLLTLGFNTDENQCYISIEVSKNCNINIDEGRVITRLFKNDKQICVLEVKNDANIIINQKNLITVIEWNGEDFICR